MAAFHVAQLNVARLRAPIDSPQLADFVANLATINALAERSPGYVWRLQTEAGDATALRVFPDPDVIVNLTVWESVDALKRFTYQSDHVTFLRRRGEWFERSPHATVALWWVRAGALPTVDDAKRRLAFLEQHGPTPYAFTFAAAGDCPPLVIEPTTLDDPVALDLIAALNTELDERYPEPGANFFRLDHDEVAPGRGAFLVARLDGVAVASGAIRRLDPDDDPDDDSDDAPRDAAEIKRMYVAPEARGRRIGAAVLAELEALAERLGAARVVLEAGPRQPDAIALYARAGYATVDCWGEYAGNPFSVCMAKDLAPAPTPRLV